jgi:hypothetical protein
MLKLIKTTSSPEAWLANVSNGQSLLAVALLSVCPFFYLNECAFGGHIKFSGHMIERIRLSDEHDVESWKCEHERVFFW